MSDSLRHILENEKLTASKIFSERVDRTLSSLPTRNKTPKIRYIVAAVILALGVTVTVGTINPALAANIPVLGSLFSHLHKAIGYDDGEYAKYAISVNKSVTDNGLTFTVNEVVCDENIIYVNYTLESDKGFNSVPSFAPFFYSNCKVDGKQFNVSGGSSGRFTDKHTYVGVVELNVGRENLPDEFSFTYEVEEIIQLVDKSHPPQSWKGKWSFSFPVSKEQIKQSTNTFSPNTRVTMGDKEITISKVKFTPLNTTLYINEKIKDGANIREDSYITKGWYLIDDKGRQLQEQGAELNSDGLSVRNYNKAKEIPKYLTVIPYENTSIPKVDEVKADLNGEFPITLNQGKIGSVTIKKIEFLPDQTVLYYRVDGKLPLTQAFSIFLYDKKGKRYTRENTFHYFPEVLDDAQHEFKSVYPPMEKEDCAQVGSIFYDTYLNLMEDYKFTIPLENEDTK